MAPAAEESGNEEDVDREGSELEPNGASAQESDQEEDDEEEEEEEPRLEYLSMTKKLTPVYRNGDATSTFLVAGDKMVRHCGQFESATIARQNRAEATIDHWNS